jgi:hypothetical protein
MNTWSIAPVPGQEGVAAITHEGVVIGTIAFESMWANPDPSLGGTVVEVRDYVARGRWVQLPTRIERDSDMWGQRLFSANIAAGSSPHEERATFDEQSTLDIDAAQALMQARYEEAMSRRRR